MTSVFSTLILKTRLLVNTASYAKKNMWFRILFLSFEMLSQPIERDLNVNKKTKSTQTYSKND